MYFSCAPSAGYLFHHSLGILLAYGEHVAGREHYFLSVEALDFRLGDYVRPVYAHECLGREHGEDILEQNPRNDAVARCAEYLGISLYGLDIDNVIYRYADVAVVLLYHNTLRCSLDRLTAYAPHRLRERHLETAERKRLVEVVDGIEVKPFKGIAQIGRGEDKASLLRQPETLWTDR